MVAPCAQLETARADVASLRGKLEEAKGQLTSNEQMIRWLNQQARRTNQTLHLPSCLAWRVGTWCSMPLVLLMPCLHSHWRRMRLDVCLRSSTHT
jgi:hypothetical protein